MAITNASRLADFGTGIGTAGAIIQTDNVNQRVGIGTTNPQAMLQVGTAISMYGSTGIVSATEFWGDGSNLEGISASGLGTALSDDDTSILQHIFKASDTLHVAAGTSIRVDSDTTSGYMAFMREGRTIVGTGATFHIGAGTTLVSDVLGIFKAVG